jgi:hypothetical protein
VKVIGHVVERPRAAPTWPPSNIARARPNASVTPIGGALVLKRYRHLYPSESYAAAPSLDALVAER